jgi:hypothetical protein
MAAMVRRHSASQADHFRRHGWVLIPRLLEPEEIEAALPGLFAIYPTPEAFHAGADPRVRAFREGAELSANQGDDARFRPLQFAGLKEFPFADQTLNLLALHPAIIAVAEDLLGVRDVRLYQAETFAKYSGVTEYEQPLHIDYTNHVMLPPRADGRYRQAQMFLYLSDVTEAHGPTRIVSRELTRDTPLATMRFDGPKAPELVAAWEASATNATGPRGSLLVYGADVVHRATRMTLAAGARFFFNLAYRPAGADWVGANPWPRKGVARPMNALVERCSVRQLEALGFPPPGHDYWEAATLQGAAERYPGLDLAPWRAALAASEARARP